MIKNKALIIVFILLVSFVLYSFIRYYFKPRDTGILRMQQLEVVSNKYFNEKSQLENNLVNSKTDEEKLNIEQEIIELQKQYDSDIVKILRKR